MIVDSRIRLGRQRSWSCRTWFCDGYELLDLYHAYPRAYLFMCSQTDVGFQKNEPVTMDEVAVIVQSIIEKGWLEPASEDQYNDYSGGKRNVLDLCEDHCGLALDHALGDITGHTMKTCIADPKSPVGDSKSDAGIVLANEGTKRRSTFVWIGYALFTCSQSPTSQSDVGTAVCGGTLCPVGHPLVALFARMICTIRANSKQIRVNLFASHACRTQAQFARITRTPIQTKTFLASELILLDSSCQSKVFVLANCCATKDCPLKIRLLCRHGSMCHHHSPH